MKQSGLMVKTDAGEQTAETGKKLLGQEDVKKICFVTTVSITLKTFVLELAKYMHAQGGYDITFICNEDREFEQSLPE